MKIKVEFWSVVQSGAQNPEPSEGLRVPRPVRQEAAAPSPAPHRGGARRVRSRGLLGEGSGSGPPSVPTPSGTVSGFDSPEVF